jgi:AraC family transcriptional regulator of adaptative response / DNA-3-methyladenine glycosylase II
MYTLNTNKGRGPFTRKLSEDSYYRALSARDRRFDGVFFVGVKSTGIYCRPVCPARTPRRDRCRFFVAAAAAEQAGFRPCLRCRPELAPGQAPVDSKSRVAHDIAARIESGALDDGGSLEHLAKEFGLSSRQLRRIVAAELGVSPVELAQTRRLLLAKQLLTETRLPIIEVAYASGFASVRRFNALFRAHYRLTPSRFRKAVDSPADEHTLRLTLSYRPPLAWDEILGFLAARAITGVEAVEDRTYLRTVALRKHRGWLRVGRAENGHALSVDLSPSLTPVLPNVLARLRSLFDLDARPDVVAEHLSADERLRPLVRRTPGLRVPGCFDAFELAWRAVLGQQVSVRSATTFAGRIANTFGEAIDTPFPQLNRLSPTASRLAAAEVKDLAKLGIVRTRAASLAALAKAAARGGLLDLWAAEPEQRLEQLQGIPGIGPWTAGYINMRAFRWPDAWPEGDLALRKALGVASTHQLRGMAEPWRPWRAYAVMHLWHSLSKTESRKP